MTIDQLASALTFHASFDHGANADFALGDHQIYTAHIEGQQKVVALTPGLGDPPLTLIPDGGKYGGALGFTLENSHVVVFKAQDNVAYSPAIFQGTASFWLNVDPNDIPGQYSDPFQLTDKDYSDACMWVDFTKNDVPPDFRMGFFGDQGAWDVHNRRGGSEQFFWRLVRVQEPPFAKGRWTHVVVTWEGVNTSQTGRARLYFDAQLQGRSTMIAEHFSWDIAHAGIRLGMGHYVGLLDDLAMFNRALTPNEINALYQLDTGVAALHT
jgi:hypothetical protein